MKNIPKSLDELPDWLTPEEARSFLRLGKSTLYERLRNGEIHARRFGRQWRIPKELLRPNGEGVKGAA
ncbi:MAG: helix-turn-helix domain-containing protein [Nitrospira sp.]|nr:helix-turn-helix domain-containing protein [Nitrospira sp.]